MDLKNTKLFQPMKVNGMILKNRFVMTGITVRYSMEHDGYFFNERHLDFYEARAKGGVGMIVTDCMPASNVDPCFPDPTIGTPIQYRSWNALSRRLKGYGTKLCLQLDAGQGRVAGPFPDGTKSIGPSENPLLMDPSQTTRAMTIEEIKQVVAGFGQQAAAAKLYGFDAVEVHSHLGLLLEQFMNPYYNHRTDEYGGSVENRARFACECVQAVRQACGPDFPILYRMAFKEYIPNSCTVEDRLEIIKCLDKAGVDMFDITDGSQDAPSWTQPPTYEGDSPLAPSAILVKTVTDKPVLSAGNQNWESALDLVENDKVDFIGLARGLLADPEYVKKLEENRPEDLRPCLRCNEFCVRNAWAMQPVTCAVNYACGHEKEFALTKAEKAKNVVVIGAGPGGLEAARAAALKGHKVTVYEKTDAPCGQAKAASEPPFKKQLQRYMQYLVTQMEKLGVNIVYGKEITADSPELAEADHIFVAVGAKRLIPNIPGKDKKNVIEVYDAHLSRSGEIGDTVVIAGGGLAGSECALELAMAGKKVTIVEMGPEIAPGGFLLNKISLNTHLAANNVEILTSHTVLSFEDNAVIVQTADGEKKTLPCDTAIMAFGSVPEKELANAIDFKYRHVSVIGDCVAAGLVGNAVRDAYAAAWAMDNE